VVGFEQTEGKLWHLVDARTLITGTVEAAVDPTFRRTMQELHTGTHILNAFVYQTCNGALVTGVQMYGDGTARMDFDVPDADNDRLRLLEGPIRRDYPEADGDDELRDNRGGARAAWSDSKQISGASADAGRQDLHRRNCRTGPAGLWRHASHLGRRAACDSHP